MKYFFIITLLYTNQLFAWTLNSNTAQGFYQNKVKIHIANTDCSNAGFSTNKYVSMIKSAVKNYWNKVPTSALYLEVEGIKTSIDITGDEHSDALLKTPKNTILAGCNESAADFNEEGILGSALMSCSGSSCRAVLILNAHPDTSLSDFSDSDIEAVIAHEIGHAIGLGHSEYQHNLMYYSVSGKNQKWLGQDDIDGVSYLYPHDSEAGLLGVSLLGNCGAVASVKANEHPNLIMSQIVSLFLGIFMVLMIYSMKLFFDKKKNT